MHSFKEFLRFSVVFMGFFLFFSSVSWGGATISTLPRLVDGGKGGWLNVSRPLTLQDMSGRLVLLDFWTYGCVNCMQVIPDLKFLEDKYGDNLLIIGVHSAKFKGEQGNSRILSAAKRFGLEHPVINDSDFAIWNAYQVQAWPTFILLDTQGQEISRYEGEGHRDELNADIAGFIAGLTQPLKPTPLASFKLSEEHQNVLSFPSRIKKSGDLFYIADSGHNRIISVDGKGKIVKSFDGFHSPRGFAVWNNKTLYVADTGVHQLVQVDIETGKRQVLGGDGTRGSVWASPWDVDFTANENIVVAMAGTHQLQLYDTVQKSLQDFAGSGAESIKDGDAKDAELAQPSALSVTADGSVYFVDAESSALRVIKDGMVKTLIGTGLFDFGLVDGTYPTARLQHPQGLHVVGNKIYIADTYNNAIRVYDIPSGELSTLKTSGEMLNEPGSIWVDGGVAYITDTNNNRILTLDIVTGKLAEFKVLPK